MRKSRGAVREGRGSKKATGPAGPRLPGGRLPLLRDAKETDQPDLMLRKLDVCSKIYSFEGYVNMEEERQKKNKTETLHELREAVQNNPQLLREPIIKNMVQMIEINVFRALPRPLPGIGGENDDETFHDPQYEHVSLVHDLFVNFLESQAFHPNTMKKYVDTSFITQLINLLNSHDEREREIVKTVLHRIYGKFLGLRGFIRKSINNIFLEFAYEDDSFNGVGELLEILGSIINGFAVPIKAEHKLFLSKVLIPLHKSRRYTSFQPHLSYCIVQFVEKESASTMLVVGSMLRVWPITNTGKEIMFLSEIEEILDVCEPHEFLNICEPLFQRLALCMKSQHFQVAERALYYWNNEYVVSLIEENIRMVMPIVFMSLYEAAKTHWSATIVMLVCNVLKTLMEMDQELFDNLAQLLMDDKNEPMDAQRTVLDAMSRAETMNNLSNPNPQMM